MLVDNETTLNNLFSQVPLLIATHCEDEATVRKNTEIYKEKYGENIPISAHPLIRSEEACYLSSSMAVALAKKHNTRLHILHISTAKEVGLFDNKTPLANKRITAEACVHHLWFSDKNYIEKGNFIKWNPAVKTEQDRDGIWKGLLDNHIDIIATDHAPHTLDEKSQTYLKAPSGGPLVQHALLAMLEKVKEGVLSIEKVVEKMAHAPAICFQLAERGFIREGYYADLVVVDPSQTVKVDKSNILYACGWSPFEGFTFSNKITGTFVNGNLVWDGSAICSEEKGMRLLFNR
jgi:dihydroorotase